ncbi:MAG: PLDc N-terminal domain-containing protein, partial [Firmicutes bacterium]|nr:PLDc N-terminal domain-containing protein [Bacillota bacterium]
MDNQENVIKLLNKKKKGLLQKLFFSRLGVIVLLIALQLLLFLSFAGWFRQYLTHYEVLRGFFTLAMVLYLFNSRMDSSAKLTWLMIISVAPFFGTSFLFFSRVDFGQNVLHDRVAEMIRRTKSLLPQKESVLQELERDPYGTEDLRRYMNRGGCFPIYDNTEVTYFPLGEDKFKVMLEEMEKAERYIFLEYFIIDEGYMWGRILDVLERKAKQGVDVRVMYDGMCEISTLSFDYNDRLAKLGIKAKAFSP